MNIQWKTTITNKTKHDLWKQHKNTITRNKKNNFDINKFGYKLWLDTYIIYFKISSVNVKKKDLEYLVLGIHS